MSLTWGMVLVNEVKGNVYAHKGKTNLSSKRLWMQCQAGAISLYYHELGSTEKLSI